MASEYSCIGNLRIICCLFFYPLFQNLLANISLNIAIFKNAERFCLIISFDNVLLAALLQVSQVSRASLFDLFVDIQSALRTTPSIVGPDFKSPL